MVNKMLTKKGIAFVFISSMALNAVRIAAKSAKMEQIDIDIMLIAMLILLFVQFIKTQNKLAGYAVLFIMYASVVMVLNYYMGFADFINLILYIPLIAAAVYYFFLAWTRFR